LLGRRSPLTEGTASHYRYPQCWADRRHRARTDRGQTYRTCVRGVPACVSEERVDPHHGRHHRAVAATHCREEAHRPAVRDGARGAQDTALKENAFTTKDTKEHEVWQNSRFRQILDMIVCASVVCRDSTQRVSLFLREPSCPSW